MTGCSRYTVMSLDQPSMSLLLNNQGRRPPIDLWDAVKGSQQGNGGSFIFHTYRWQLRV